MLIAGSVVAAAAQTAWVEVVGRAVQGVGGALIAPSAMTLLMMLFAHDPKELGKAMALYGVATLAATKLLPAVGSRRGAVDVLGAAAVTAGLALAVFAIRGLLHGYGAQRRCVPLVPGLPARGHRAHGSLHGACGRRSG